MKTKAEYIESMKNMQFELYMFGERVTNIVTEYGIANLRGKSLQERALFLISIAHPDFHEELTKELGTMRCI